MLYRTLTLNAGLLASVTLSGCNVHDTTPHSTERGVVSGPRTRMVTVPPNADDFEKDFLHRMIDHHQTTLTVLRIAERRATHAELKRAAEAQVAEKSVQLRQMQSYASNWYWWRFPPHVTDDMKPEVDRLSGLPDEAFDLACLEVLVRQDGAGIEIAKPMVEGAPHPEAREMARTLVTQLASEADQFTHWLETQYDAKPGAVSP